MSVIEFFIAYWDWWFFAGFIVAGYMEIDSKVTVGAWASLVIFCAPPIGLIFLFRFFINR